MYLAKLEIENYRIFGSRETGEYCSLELNPGLNVVLGENDSGKTCLIDAIRLLLGSVTDEYFPVTPDDFHVSGEKRAELFKILGEIRGFSVPEAAPFLEYLGCEGEADKSTFVLRVWVEATRVASEGLGPRRRPVTVVVKAGPDSDGKRLDGACRDLLRSTYLKPLRDAASEMAAKRGSRLSQVLKAFPGIKGQAANDWDEQAPDQEPSTLLGIMRKAEHRIRQNSLIREAEGCLNEKYLQHLSLGDAPLRGRIGPQAHELRQILERLELAFEDVEAGATKGLGTQNLLFMATELLASAPDDLPDLPLVLIEEPEAHLHPQFQARLIGFLRASTKVSEAAGRDKLQVILTSHSPNLACSVSLESVIWMHRGRAYPLGPRYTMLAPSDYGFLERFLDVTKANLFFAQGVLIVEGDAEALLLPTVARLLGRPFDKYGVSVVNVGHVGLFRYSRIFRRQDGDLVGVRAACLADLDIPPDEAKGYLPEKRRTWSDFTDDQVTECRASRKRNDGGAVKTFVSDHWTLEYALAACGLSSELLAATMATRRSRNAAPLSDKQLMETVAKARQVVEGWTRKGWDKARVAATIYRPLAKKEVSKAECAQWLARILELFPVPDLAQRLPGYIVDAINYVTRAPSPVEAVPETADGSGSEQATAVQG